MNIAIVEHDEVMASFIKTSLEDLGHNVLGVFEEAGKLLDLVKKKSVDLVCMEIDIIGAIDGIQCAMILRNEHNVPSVFITSHDLSETINDAMYASPLGYIIKPVSVSEIEATLAIAAKSIGNVVEDIIDRLSFGAYEYLVNHQVLMHNNKPVKLSKNEHKVMSLLFNSFGDIVASEKIMHHIWGGESYREDALRELIYRLRKKLPNLHIRSFSKTGYAIMHSFES